MNVITKALVSIALICHSTCLAVNDINKEVSFDIKYRLEKILKERFEKTGHVYSSACNPVVKQKQLPYFVGCFCKMGHENQIANEELKKIQEKVEENLIKALIDSESIEIIKIGELTRTGDWVEECYNELFYRDWYKEKVYSITNRRLMEQVMMDIVRSIKELIVIEDRAQESGNDIPSATRTQKPDYLVRIKTAKFLFLEYNENREQGRLVDQERSVYFSLELAELKNIVALLK